MIQKYFSQIRNEIEKYNHIIEDYSLTDKTYSDAKGYIDGKLVFINDSILEFSEVKNIETGSKIKYRYHYQTHDNQLIFRYDNANHHRELKSFPHHKHLYKSIVPCYEPDIKAILQEIEVIVLRNEKKY
ncbi:MAG: DUF6516 family protein [Prolixibacteraceae bacterium]|nr:DUF6516 family protein [Prolixibacteraceae bacterium]